MATEPLIHRLPLRADFDAEMKLPRDLTEDEAYRLAQLLAALTMPADSVPVTDSKEG